MGAASRQQTDETSQFVPRVIKPDKAAAESRRAYRTALARLAEQFEALMERAEDPGELEHWHEALARLTSFMRTGL